MIENELPLVSIICLAYNHEPYIRECLEGFVMQTTNFPFEIVISDDASTDNTGGIIREYESKHPNLFVPFYHDRNKYSLGIPFFKDELFPACRGKYIALCEGDDFWVDPLKLQKQVDFLEANPNYVFCCHRFKIFIQQTGVFRQEYSHKYYKPNSNLEIDLELFSKTWVTQPLTALIHSKALYSALCERNKFKGWRDVHMFYYLLRQGKGISLNDFMGVYRWHSGGIASIIPIDIRYKKGYCMYKELYDNNSNDKYLRKKYIYNLIRYLRHGKFSSYSSKKTIFMEGLNIHYGIKERYDLTLALIIPDHIVRFLVRMYKIFISKN